MTDDDDPDLPALMQLRDIVTYGGPAAEVVPLQPRALAAARDSLPDELRPVFGQLVADYHAAVFELGDPKALPDYSVLATLVQQGWHR